jgi:hypothetical protein
MFVQTITTSRAEFEASRRLLDIEADPPEALLAAVAFASGDDEVTVVNVWESPGDMAQFFVDRIGPKTGGAGLTGDSRPRGEPLFFWTRT